MTRRIAVEKQVDCRVLPLLMIRKPRSEAHRSTVGFGEVIGLIEVAREETTGTSENPLRGSLQVRHLDVRDDAAPHSDGGVSARVRDVARGDLEVADTRS